MTRIVIFLILATFYFNHDAFLCASPFKTATVTEVVKDVKVVKGAGKPTSAKVNETITAQDIIRTGRDSRTELRFQDNTLARVGANSVFSFSPDSREINLQQGSVLFNSEKGKGGGQIKTAAATAAVTGTTIIVVATANGGFKLLILEGKSRVQLPGGAFVDMQAGQMTFINPGQNTRPEVLTFDLEALIQGSRLVEGFSDPLDSMEKVQSAIDKQNQLISDGKLEDTGQLIVFVNEEGQVQVIDMNSLTQILDIDLATQLAQEELNKASAIQTALATAFSQNHIVNTDTINPDRIFTDVAALKSSVFNQDGFYNPLPNNAEFAPSLNTYISSEYVDLSNYGATDVFAFLAEENIYFEGGLHIDEETYYLAAFLGDFYDPLDTLVFQARGDFIFSDGVRIEFYDIDNVVFRGQGNATGYDVQLSGKNVQFILNGNFNFQESNFIADVMDITTDGNLTLDSTSISASNGDLHLGALGTLSLTGTWGSYLSAYGAGDIILDSDTQINIDNSSIYANGGLIRLNNSKPGGLVDILNSTFADYSYPLNLEIVSHNINIVGGFLSTYGPTATVNLMGNMSSGTISVDGLDMSSLPTSPNATQISMQAYTINLANIDFPAGSEVHLTSGLENTGGYPNFGTSLPGRVNFINNVSKGGTGNIMNDEYSFDLYRSQGGGDIILNEVIMEGF